MSRTRFVKGIGVGLTISGFMLGWYGVVNSAGATVCFIGGAGLFCYAWGWQDAEDRHEREHLRGTPRDQSSGPSFDRGDHDVL